jgi:hypothetical protein
MGFQILKTQVSIEKNHSPVDQTTSETCGKITPLHFAALQQSEEKTIPAE